MKKKLSEVAILLILLVAVVSCAPDKDDPALMAKARKIHDRVLTVDTHCDTPMTMVGGEFDIGQRHEPGQRGSGKIDLPRMAEGGMDAIFFAVFVSQDELTPEAYDKAKAAAHEGIDVIHKMCEDYPQLVGLAISPEDAYQLEKEGKRAAFIGMENGYPIGQDLSLVQEYYDRGVRYITLCHGGDNDICDSSTDRQHPEDNGLSEFGREVVTECNRLGIMVDVSHISDKSFYDLLQATEAPFIASHSGVRAICDHPRNLTDDMIKSLAERGGVIQVCFVSSFLIKQKPNPERDKAFSQMREKYGPYREIKDEAIRQKVREEYMAIYEKYPGDPASVMDLVNHIDHVVALVGVDHVGIGSDFDGGGSLEDCDEVSQMPRITEELLRRGYSEDAIEKIWGGNLMRVFRRVEDISRQAD
jgi:membrane dipeptidase